MSTPTTELRGLDTFAGPLLDLARADLEDAVAGRRVALIAAGARSVALLPRLVEAAELVKVFQPTPSWILPRPVVPVPAGVRRLAGRWAGAASARGWVWEAPIADAIETVGRVHLRRSVADPWTRRQLTPDRRPDRLELLASNDYYRTLQLPGCQLITWPIASLSPAGVRTCDGIEHAVDCIVLTALPAPAP